MNTHHLLLRCFILLMPLLGMMPDGYSTVYKVLNVNDSGPGSLRDAITQANGHLGKDTVKFQIAGTGQHTIALATDLPSVTDSLFIDGFSQAGTGNHAIILDGTGNAWIGLTFSKSGSSAAHTSMVEGLIIRNFYYYGILTDSDPILDGIVIKNCLIGSCDTGIYINSIINSEVSGNRIYDNQKGILGMYGIGYTTNSNFLNNKIYNNINDGISFQILNQCNITGNEIYNNGGNGIYLLNGQTNIIKLNKIYNNTKDGIYIASASKTSLFNNNIYSNENNGIFFLGSQIGMVSNNLIGTDSVWTDRGNNKYGICIGTANYSNSDLNILNNTIVFNKDGGIFLKWLDQSKITGNYIGTNNLKQDLGNGGNGIELSSFVTNLKIGDGTQAGANSICYNKKSGIENTYYNSIFEASYNYVFSNVDQPINLGDIEFNNWGNKSKLTPYILEKKVSGTSITLRIRAEAADTRFEVYKANERNDMMEYITDNATHLGNGIWEASFNWSQPLDNFVVLAAGSLSNTSEVGVLYQKDQVVINTNEKGFGSLKYVAEITSAFADTSMITFNIQGNGPHIIRSLYGPIAVLNHSTVLDGSMEDSVVIDYSSNTMGGVSLVIGDFVNGTSGTFGTTTIKSIHFKGPYGGVSVQGHQKFKILDCSFTNVGTGVIADQIMDTLIVNNCRFFKTSLLQSFAHYPTTKVEITNNIVDSSTYWGLSLDCGKDILIKDNTITNSASWGIIWNTNNYRNIDMINNHISGNGNHGVYFQKGCTGTLTIKGNTIGLSKDRSKAMPNYYGLYLSGFPASNIIIDSNWVSGNLGIGVYVPIGNARISRNYIGTNEQWMDFGNRFDAINAAYSSSKVRLGGLTRDSANYIGYNKGGVLLYEGMVLNNYIGVTPGFKDMGNGMSGIYTSQPWVGDTMIIQGNYIGFNKEHGINVQNDTILVMDNFIGGDGLHDFGNAKWGIKSPGHMLARSNYIAHNDSGAVSVTGAYGKLSRNLFGGDQPVAIFLNNGAGNSNKLAPAFLAGAVSAGLTLSGSGVNGDTIEVFANSNNSVPEEALTYAGAAVVTGGNWSLTIPEGLAFDRKQDNYYVSTATDLSGNTSALTLPYKVALHLCPSPVLNSLPASIDLCQGDSVQVDPGVLNGVTYTWFYGPDVYSGKPQLNGKKGGQYRLLVRDSFGCTASDTISITEKPSPVLADFLMAAKAGKGDDVVIVDISNPRPDSLVWNFGNAQSSQVNGNYVLTYPETGTYKVTVTSYLGTCTRSGTHEIVIVEESTAGKNDNIFSAALMKASLGPNPNTGSFKVEVELAAEDNITFELLNAMGMSMGKWTSQKALKHSRQMELGDIHPGNYFFRITSGSEVKMIRLLKQ